MNFFFGQTHSLSTEVAHHEQTQWLNKTIFSDYKDCVSTHVEDGFSLTLINDPKHLCAYQSKSIYVDEKFVCATDCQLFNKNKLATKLKLNIEAANEEFFIAAFLKWGKEFPDHFDGKFSFIIWNRTDKTLLAGIDALGYGNFSYSDVNKDFYFSTDIDILLNQPKIDKSINLKRFYQCLFNTNNNSPEQTYFRHCYYCPASHVVELSNGKIKAADYWKLNERQHLTNNHNLNKNSTIFNSILEQAIEKEIPTNSKAGLMLSGGYDSSLLAALLSKNGQRKQGLTCYSYYFSLFKSCDESKYTSQTLEQFKLVGKFINCDTKIALAQINNHHICLGTIHLDSFYGLPQSIYQQANNDQCSILISGLNGDDLFSGTRLMYADLLKQKKYRTILKKFFNNSSISKECLKLINLGIRPLLPSKLKYLYRIFIKSHTKNLNPYGINPNSINKIDSQPMLLKCRLFHCQNLLKLVYFRNMPEEIYSYRRHLYLDFNLILCLPYYNKSLIEFMWSLPKEFLQVNGNIRGLQWNSLSLEGLSHIVKRKHKTTFVELIDAGLLKNQKYIEEIANRSLLLKHKIISNIALKKLTDNIGKDHISRNLTLFCLLELWLKKNENEVVFDKSLD